MSKRFLISKIPKVYLTTRGFEFIEWPDRYGKSCVLQQSSLAEYEPPGSSAVWLGSAEVGSATMHLDVEQVTWLVQVLSNWLETGSFESKSERKNENAETK